MACAEVRAGQVGPGDRGGAETALAGTGVIGGVDPTDSVRMVSGGLGDRGRKGPIPTAGAGCEGPGRIRTILLCNRWMRG